MGVNNLVVVKKCQTPAAKDFNFCACHHCTTVCVLPTQFCTLYLIM